MPEKLVIFWYHFFQNIFLKNIFCDGRVTSLGYDETTIGIKYAKQEGRGRMEQVAKSYAMRHGLPVYVDRYQELELAGRVFSPIEGPVLFDGVLSLLNSLDGICDALGYPQNTHQLRSFVPGSPEHRADAAEEAKSVEEIVKREKEEPRGTAATFVVQVRFRQNATWQGSIKWVDSGKVQNFRSTLELINLMEGALKTTQGATTEAEWEDDKK